MNYYTSTIPPTLAEKLKEKGCEHPYAIPEQWEYGFVFDWLMKKGWLVGIGREYDFANELVTERFDWGIDKVAPFSSHPDDGCGFCDTWHEAANAAIEKALTLI